MIYNDFQIPDFAAMLANVQRLKALNEAGTPPAPAPGLIFLPPSGVSAAPPAMRTTPVAGGAAASRAGIGLGGINPLLLLGGAALAFYLYKKKHKK